ncbi:MAG: TolC family protein [Phycisphaerae bacterium]|nr:TolC family protein [Gemmatimonadaceae bacterium]
MLEFTKHSALEVATAFPRVNVQRRWGRAVGVAMLVVATAAQSSNAQVRAPVSDAPSAAWQALGDTTLVRLTRTALRENRDVQAAQATVRGARLARRLVAFDFAPTVTVNYGLARRRFSAAQFPGVPATLRDADIHDAGFDASWEIDLFGRTRNTYRAQGDIAASVGEDLRDVQLSLESEVARTYFELRGAERQLAVANRNVVNQQRTLQLTVDRLLAGRGTAFDRERASAQVSTTLADVAAIEARRAAASYQLSVLVGGPPDVTPLPVGPDDDLDVEESTSFPLPAAPAFERVSALISERPDVRSADERFAAARALVDAARADYLPRLNIVGSVGYNTANTSTFGQREASRYAIGPVISWPAFNFGRVHTRSEATRASADQARARRDGALMAAQAEVQSSIVMYSSAQTRLGLLRDAASSSERGAGLARMRFDGGESGFLEVLDAQRNLFAAQDRLARGETDAAIAYVALFKALGGRWR